MAQQRTCRNAPCRCGSGKKFKNCCYRPASSPQAPPRCSPRARPCDEAERSSLAVCPHAAPSPSTPPQDRDWQQVHIKLHDGEGRRVYLVALHSSAWLRANGVVQGGTILVNLPKEGVRGEGQVTKIEPSPLPSEDEGRVMTFMRRLKAVGTETERAAWEDALAIQGQTYFGEPISAANGSGIRLPFNMQDGRVAELILPRPEAWMQAHAEANDRLPPEQPTGLADWRMIRVRLNGEDGVRVHFAFLMPRQWIEEVGVAAGETAFLMLPWLRRRGEAQVVGIEPAPYLPEGEFGWSLLLLSQLQAGGRGKVDTLKVGDYVVTYTPKERGQAEEDTEAEVSEVVRKRIELVLDRPGGCRTEVELLRDEAWVRAQVVMPGSCVFLDMPDKSARGWARVRSVEPCMVLRRCDGASGMVTGVFRHSKGLCGILRLKGVSEPFGFTRGHPIWSVDKRDWVPVDELQVGETVKTIRGTAAVESFTMGERPEPVYCLEVEGDHVFRAGEAGLLVHNASVAPQMPGRITKDCDPCRTAMPSSDSVEGRGGSYKANYEGYTATGDRQRVCRINSISGPIADFEGQGEDPDNSAARRALRTLFFGMGLKPGDMMVQLSQDQIEAAATHSAGHLIGDKLGGPGDVRNLVPLLQEGFNNQRAAWGLFEVRIRQAISDRKINMASMIVEVNYTDVAGIQRYIPTRLTVTLSFRDKKNKQRTESYPFEHKAYAANTGLPGWLDTL